MESDLQAEQNSLLDTIEKKDGVIQQLRREKEDLIQEMDLKEQELERVQYLVTNALNLAAFNIFQV